MSENNPNKTKKDFVELRACVICNGPSKGDDILQEGTEQGLATLKEVTNARRNVTNNTSYNEAMDRICIVFGSASGCNPKLFWHRKCYSDFTHKGKIKRLSESTSKDDTAKRRKVSSDDLSSRVSSAGACSTRRSAPPVNWDLCMFCQNPDEKQCLISVSTFNVSKSILESSKLDNKMRIRLAGVNYLIAAEGKYHQNCRNDYSYNTSKTKKEAKNTDIALIFLCKELQYAAENEQVLQLSDVWQRYQDIALETETTIPQSFLSRRTLFKEKLVERVGSLFEFVQPLERSKFEREPLLIPRKYSHNVLADHYYSTIIKDDKMLTMPSYQHQDDAFLSHFFHIALQIRGDVIAMPGHEGFDVTEAAVIDCVPDRLYMFLNVLLGGQTLIDSNSETAAEGSAKRQTLILSLAQDIVYAVSEGKKWTPKHIGLASTLHQLTRSKHLVELFHRAGHILSYKQVLKIDTALAEHTLQSMNKENGAVFPPNLSSNTFTHYTANNLQSPRKR